MKVLLTDPDWTLINQAYSVGRHEEYDLVAESSWDKALKLAKIWRPKVIIATPECLDAWNIHGDELQDVLSRSTVIVTASDGDAGVWMPWARQGYEVLMKPLVHPLQLSAAIATATAGTAPAKSHTVSA